ncbi:MAG: autotransporter-associated beta strand repeat-containing protein [Verrucomicrobiota bacterium JB024]|nr:autotransporter-associated beta strand repeat-containing protein [Verrucomicrobiota bacterium JB024]
MRNTPLLFCAFVLSTVPAWGINIYDSSSAVNDVFTSGFNTESPLRNTDPSFVGARYDWTPLGWLEDTPTGRVPHATVISPMHCYGARHAAISVIGSNVQMVNAYGQIVERTIEPLSITAAIGVSDIDVTRMEAALTAADRIEPVRLLDIASNSYSGQRLFMLGSDGMTVGSQVATASLLTQYTTTFTVKTHSTDATSSFMIWEGGDSGSPVFIPYKGKLAIAGAAWYAGGQSSSILPKYGSYDPITPVNARLAQHGYALKWTIYDEPSKGVHSAGLWTGAGTTNDFNVSANWSTGLFQSRPVVFDSSAATERAVHITPGAELRGILFRPGNAAEGFTLFGGDALTLGAVGVRNESVALQRFTMPVTLAGSQNWEAAAGPLEIAGPVDTAGYLLVMDGDYASDISAAVSGSGSLAKDGAGTLTLSAPASYAGTTFLHNGTLRLIGEGTLPETRLCFIAGNEAVLDLNGHAQRFTDISSARGGRGRIVLGGATRRLDAAWGGIYFYEGSIEGAGSVVKSGAGFWSLGGANSFTGDLTLEAGTVRLADAGALPAGAGVRIGGNALLELGAADLTLAPGTGPGQISFSGSGGFSADEGIRIVNLGGDGRTLGWGQGGFLPNGAYFMLAAQTGDGELVIRNRLNLTQGSRVFYVNGGDAVIEVRLEGEVTNGTLVKQGGGVLELAAANSYGDTQMSGGTVVLSHPQALGSGSLTINSGALVLGAGDFTRSLGTAAGEVRFTNSGGFGARGATRRVDLGGAGETVVWASGNFIPNGQNLILSSQAADATVDFVNPINGGGSTRKLQVLDGAAGVDARLSGGFYNGVLYKTGDGVLELPPDIYRPDSVQVAGGGLLALAEDGLGTGNLILRDGGVLLLGSGDFERDLGTGDGQVRFMSSGGFGAWGADRTVSLDGGGVLTWGSGSFLPSGSTLYLSPTASDATLIWANALNLAGTTQTVDVANGSAAVDARLAGVISNGGLTKAGAGTLELTGANTYTGNTQISGGVLRVGPGALPSGSPLVLDGGVLELSGLNFTRAVGTGAGQVNIAGHGGFSAMSVTRVVNLGGGGAQCIWGGQTGFLASGKTLRFSSEGSDATVVFQNPINLGNTAAGLRRIEVADGRADVDARMTGVISSGARGWGIDKTGAGTLELTGTHTYTNRTVVSQGRLLVNGDLSGTIRVEVAAGAIFEMNGDLNQARRILLEPGAVFELNGDLPKVQRIEVGPGAILKVNGNITAHTVVVSEGGQFLGSGTLQAVLVENRGSFTADGTGTVLTVTGAVENTGEFAVSGYAYLSVWGVFDNTGTLTMGTAAPQKLPAGLNGNGAVQSPAVLNADHPLLEYCFDDWGTQARNRHHPELPGKIQNASFEATPLRTVSMLGVSGRIGDRAYDGRDADLPMTVDNSPTGGRILVGDLDPVSGEWLRSLTVQGWFKSSEVFAGRARLLDKGGNTSIQLRGSINPGGEGRMACVIDAIGVESDAVYTQVGEWVFFAFTYDGTQTVNNARFYIGTRNTPVTLVNTRTINAGALDANANALIIGNKTTWAASSPTSTNANASFVGLLDNIRLYGSLEDATGALSLARLERLRRLDVNRPAQPPKLDLARGANGRDSVAYGAVAGHSYELQRSYTLQPGSWETLGTVSAGDDVDRSWEDADASDVPCFYRLVIDSAE